MITIVEGADCTGKSTLIQNAFSSAGWKHHFGPPSSFGAWEDYTKALVEAQLTISSWDDDEVRGYRRHIVYDRYIYGELIYPEVMGRTSTLDQIKVRMLERVLLSHQAMLIMCMTSEDTAIELWRERKGTEMIDKEQKYKQSYELWRQLIAKGIPALPTITFDLEKDSFQEIRDAALMQRSPKNDGPGYGMYRSSSIVLVGEQVNHNVDICGWPFVAEEGSSYWLTQKLNELDYPENQLYWINAFDRHDNETSAGFLKNMVPSKVITLGKTAELWAKRNKISQWVDAVRHIAHPQYHKRFKNSEPYALEEALNG